MNSVQESKNELEASIRYAENAISSAKATIESMEFRQQMAQKNYQEQTGREAALEQEIAELTDVIDRMGEDITGDSVTIKQQRDRIDELESKVQGQYDDICMLEAENSKFRKEKEASSGPCGCQAYRDLEYKTEQAEAWKKKYYDFKEALVKAGDPRVVEGVSGVIMNKPTMPVIPKDVAIAIFREGTLFGVNAACDEIDGERINIEECEYVGDFMVQFQRDIELEDVIDFDWVRSKVGDYDEDNVTANLEGLCARKNFECRIHGIDDQEEKKND